MKIAKITYLGYTYENADRLYRYYGNCVKSFDEESGESLIPIFDDVSDFAVVDENSEEVDKGSNLPKLQMTPDLVKIASNPNTILTYADYRDIYFLYDKDTDIHYFFAK